jgi:ESS family glutamate:Na+ symporter
MVTAAIAAITIVLLRGFWVPILIVSVAGGIVTTVAVVYTASRLFTDHRLDRAIMFYGNMTGTLSTGLALLRVIDPDFETPVATDYMYGSGITFVLAIPLILLLNLPGYWHTTGNPLYLWMTWGGLGAYLVFSMVSYRLLAGRRAFLGGPGVWMEE